MSVTVKIPTQLRALTDGASEVEASGPTVGALIEDLERKHPGIRERIVDESGALRRFVNVYLDDEDVRFLQGIETELAEGAKVSIIPAVAGGASPRNRIDSGTSALKGSLARADFLDGGFDRSEPSCSNGE